MIHLVSASNFATLPLCHFATLSTFHFDVGRQIWRYGKYMVINYK